MKAEYVVGFLFTEDRQRVALIQKNRPEWQAGRWNGIGGKRNSGEDWGECMTREFHEETGVHIPAEGWEHTVTLFNNHFECRFFRAFSDTALDVQTMEDETVAIHHMRDLICGSIPVINNLYWLVPLQLDDGLHFPVPPIREGKPSG